MSQSSKTNEINSSRNIVVSNPTVELNDFSSSNDGSVVATQDVSYLSPEKNNNPELPRVNLVPRKRRRTSRQSSPTASSDQPSTHGNASMAGSLSPILDEPIANDKMRHRNYQFNFSLGKFELAPDYYLKIWKENTRYIIFQKEGLFLDDFHY